MASQLMQLPTSDVMSWLLHLVLDFHIFHCETVKEFIVLVKKVVLVLLAPVDPCNLSGRRELRSTS